mmetsp:Transcript_34811/g.96056  ORF Transcript_34811/g.96056 Transcript_34811/m.96056 type:complete len:205 (-) Transcript_34811:813-1427(-)
MRSSYCVWWMQTRSMVGKCCSTTARTGWWSGRSIASVRAGMLYTLDTDAMYSFNCKGAFLSGVIFCARAPRGSAGSASSIGFSGSCMRDTNKPSMCSSSPQSPNTDKTWPMPKTSCARQSTLKRESATRVITAETTSFHNVPPSALTMTLRAAVITIFMASHAMASQYFLASASGAVFSAGIAGKCCSVRNLKICLQGSSWRAK